MYFCLDMFRFLDNSNVLKKTVTQNRFNIYVNILFQNRYVSKF